MFTVDEAREFLLKAHICFGIDEDGIYDEAENDPKWNQTINLNDAMHWAMSDMQYIEDEELPRVARLFWLYGWAGILYWVCKEKRKNEMPTFEDAKRQIQFVENEENIMKECPESSKRAYLKIQYTIG
jgi:hypothetical protein